MTDEKRRLKAEEERQKQLMHQEKQTQSAPGANKQQYVGHRKIPPAVLTPFRDPREIPATFGSPRHPTDGQSIYLDVETEEEQEQLSLVSADEDYCLEAHASTSTNIEEPESSAGGNLTYMGELMAAFPLDPMLAKTLIASAELHCSNETISIVAMLSIDNIFQNDYFQKDAQKEAQKTFYHPDGDH
ncbi:hypothetical protein niasHT_023790 [Heterodera trifolii]|uniref:Helicase-associated domain-containing protein n=1 Tax=Heterodera trifolii TaxID=157864 RepID=A0ABD2JRW0_9BILA